MNKTEYDLSVAVKLNQVRRIALVDFDGRTLHTQEWKAPYVSFKIMKANNTLYRFSYVFDGTAYYLRSGVLDLKEGTPAIGLNE